ncbi:nuclear transport factor 2 family protein [Algoriphagus sp. AGSA1]|uniref:nuclear transport factor 2 family protein n=1 Tax=Algoriphagus sp. AGSA1 TaxID=2907213 RepID=UPI001F246911|nr:nuclear transport factor 2 family protein [Algoriphagus sp. AGSA1]MCE7054282.1 nuclear transport factor 2 family protein [Algoriphagus sp. AGSA1]
MINKKKVLLKANEAVSKGDNEGFLSHCTETVAWVFEGDTTIRGKESLKKWMGENYTKPPQFQVKRLIEDDECVVAMGAISLKDKTGVVRVYSYCDVWQFDQGKMDMLNAFVVGI